MPEQLPLISHFNAATQYSDPILSGRRFLPLNIVEERITKEAIKYELSPPQRFQLFPTRIPQRLIDDILGRAKKIFAILVFIQQTKIIKNLLDDGLTDEDLPLSWDREGEPGLLRSCNGSTTFRTFSDPQNQHILHDFIDRQWLLLAPVLDTAGQELELHSDCPLPITKLTTVGNGLSSVVFVAEVHGAHQRGFQVHDGLYKFAIKKFKTHDDKAFRQEKDNLNLSRKINHPHLIKHYAICQNNLGYFVFFPWAKGKNLEDFWQRQSEHVRKPFDIFWGLHQMQGICSALEALHKERCRHGDIKPENILHFMDDSDGRLVLADMGISRRHRELTKLRQTGTETRATTPSYQAPEAVYKTSARSRLYDLWSFGCICLEYTLFLLYNFEAIEEFTTERRSNVRGEDPSYFYADDEKGNAILHPKVAQKIDQLLHDHRCADGTVLGRFVHLIADGMLQVEHEDRWSAEDVHKELAEIVERARQESEVLQPLSAVSQSSRAKNSMDRDPKDSVISTETTAQDIAPT